MQKIGELYHDFGRSYVLALCACVFPSPFNARNTQLITC